MLRFRKGKLARLTLYGEAFCTLSTYERDDVSVSGDTLFLNFEAGKLTEIQASGAVQGGYRADTEGVP